MACDSPSYLAYTEYATSPVHRHRLEFILSGLPAKRCSVLDVGCGVGNIARPIASQGHQVSGIDIHQGSIAVAKERNDFPNLEFRCQPVEQAAIEDFDAIVLSEVLEHVGDCQGMLRSITSRMERGTILILTVPNGYSAAELLCRPSYRLKRHEGGERIVAWIKRLLGARDLTTANTQTPHVHFFTRQRLEQLFHDHSLEIVRSHKSFFVWPVYETFFGSRRLAAVADADLRLSQKLPHGLCSCWGWVLRKL